MDYGLGILTAVVSVGVSWGIFTTEIKQQKKELEELKNRVESFEKDHDLIIRLDTKMDGMDAKMDEINESVRELRNIIQRKAKK